MKLSQALELNNKQAVICVCGGGGKTSTLFRLADELKDKKILLTTTTRIFKPEKTDKFDLIITEDSKMFIEKIKTGKLKNRIICGSLLLKDQSKLIGCTINFIKEVKEFFDFIIIEADGSAEKPIKAPAVHEPVVPGFTDIYIGVIGLDCLGKTGTAENVHRARLFSGIREKKSFEPVNKEDLAKLINSPSGLFKNAPQNCTKIVLLNKADLIGNEKSREIVDYLWSNTNNSDLILLNSYKLKESVIPLN